MRTGDNIRQRSDGRYEARFIKGRSEDGKIQYGYAYGKTYEEAKEKREWQLEILRRNRMPKLMNLLILGAGSHGREVYEVALGLRAFNKISFLDDNLKGEGIIGKCQNADQYINEYPLAFPAVGNADLRKKWIGDLVAAGFVIPTLIDTTAVISRESSVGYGTVVCARAVVNNGATVGNGCIVSSGAVIAREAKMPDWGFINSGETLLENGEIK